MTDPVTLELDAEALVVFTWLGSGTLSVDLWRPGYLKEGLLLAGSLILSSDEATAFLERLAER